MAFREPPHITVLKRWYSQLIHSIAVKDVLANLMSAGIVSMREMERITAKCENYGQIAASEILMMDVLMRNPDPDCFQYFTDALESSNREYVAEMMRQEYSRILDFECNRVTRERAEYWAARRGQLVQLMPEYNDYRRPVQARNTQARGIVGAGQVSGEGHHRSIQMHVTGQPASDAQDLGARNVVTDQGQCDESMDYQDEQVALAAGQRMKFLVEEQRRHELNRNEQIEYPPDTPLLPDLEKDAFVQCVSKEALTLDVNDRLGRGSYGLVYRGIFSGTYVAVKEVVLNINKRNRKKKREDLWKEYVTPEFQVSAYVRHANIALLMAYALGDGSLYLIYELIDGHNMQQIVFDEEVEPLYRLDKKEKFFLMGHIAQALAFLHQCNPKIIHGDIKPNNMIVTKDKTIAKLCDLGLNKLKAKNALTTTKGSVLPGTPMYMAREQVLESKPCSPRTDIWSMGAAMYEVFFEEEVWQLEDGKSMREMKKMFDADRKPRLVEEPEERYSDVAELVGKCMGYLEENRPTALQLVKELKYKETKFLQSIENTGMEY